MVEPVAELVGLCLYDLLSLLLPCHTREEFRLSHFLTVKGGFGGHGGKRDIIFTPKVAHIMAERALMKPLALLTDLIFQAFRYIICPFLNSTISLSCSWFDAQN